MAHNIQIVFACEDPDRLATFWAGVLGYEMQPPPDGYATWDDFADAVGIPVDKRNDISACTDPAGVGPRLLFERWDGGAPNQRVHLDVNAIGRGLTEEERPARLDEERTRLEALGATFHREARGMAGEHWYEFHDPEGNWFCVQ
ncbi:MAG TPA: VOC family protein [Acidimicrobiia bacterium]|nr:VOC family protein [Acidimicrobiia bacterium]